MKCINCRMEGKIQLYFKQFMCDSCFAEMVERRTRKEMRAEKLFKKNDNITVLDDDSFKAKVAVEILKSALKNLPAEINAVKKITDTGKKIIVPWSIDDENREFLERIFFDKKIENNSNQIKILKSLTDAEIKIFADIKKLKHKTCEEKNDFFSNQLVKIHSKYPTTRYALAKTSRALKKL
ncbi:MAG TPA: hypothetical protein VI894_02940 [Candidatus Nanoarchaeia archaeon]|nr:hypothetical protein [Candidatus Nanoarchaeia archaeon]